MVRREGSAVPNPVSLVISVRARPECREAFLEGIARNARASVRDEPGCLRFDVTADAADPDLFWVHEVFRDQGALEEHRRSPHFLVWQQEKAQVVVAGSPQDHLGRLVVDEGAAPPRP